MSRAKRALLVASPYGNLEGPENDVEMVARVLEKRGFLLHRCCGREATREGIRAAWRQLISETSTGDVVVIYYSGHGGAALPGKDEGDTNQQWRLQFIVPMDYDDSPGAFSGISEVELSQLLLDTTDKTQNVTAIFDCCHSGRMVRDPSSGKESIRKNIPPTRHQDIVRHIEQLRQTGMLRERTIPNPHAVRIAAAAPWESAYEYTSARRGKVGAFTEALVRVLEEGEDDNVTWKTTMHRIQELVNVSFPQQHPRVEGPNTRFLFSLEHHDSGAFLIKQEARDKATIQAGRVAGVREQNIYAVMLPGSERVDMEKIIATATVIKVRGFNAVASLNWRNGSSALPSEGALAFLIEEAPLKLSVVVPESLVALRDRVALSSFIQCCGEDEMNPLLEFRQQEGTLTLRNQRGVILFSRRLDEEQPSTGTYNAAVTVADNVARARLFLTQTCDDPEEEFHQDVGIELRVVQGNDSERAIEPTGEDSIPENSEVLISLHNRDQHARAFVSVFEVEENGQINAISANPDGIDLEPQRSHRMYPFDASQEGLRVKWPHNISKAQAVVETLVFVISSAPVNLQFLESPELAARGDYTTHSSLGQRLLRLAQGTSRQIEREKRVTQVQYRIVQLSFFLEPVG
jgi:hypothetical protein